MLKSLTEIEQVGFTYHDFKVQNIILTIENLYILISLDSSSALKVLHSKHVHGCLATLDCNCNSDCQHNKERVLK